MHFKDLLQIQEEVVWDEPYVQEVVTLHQVDEQLEVCHIVVFLLGTIVVVHDYLRVKYFFR